MSVALSAVFDPVSKWTPDTVWQRLLTTGLPTALHGLGLKELNDGMRNYRVQLGKLEDQTALQQMQDLYAQPLGAKAGQVRLSAASCIPLCCMDLLHWLWARHAAPFADDICTVLAPIHQ